MTWSWQYPSRGRGTDGRRWNCANTRLAYKPGLSKKHDDDLRRRVSWKTHRRSRAAGQAGTMSEVPESVATGVTAAS